MVVAYYREQKNCYFLFVLVIKSQSDTCMYSQESLMGYILCVRRRRRHHRLHVDV